MALLRYLSKFSSLNIDPDYLDEYNDYVIDYCQKFSTEDIIRVQGIRSEGHIFTDFPTFTLVNKETGVGTVITPTNYVGEEGTIVDYLLQDSDNPLISGLYYLSIYDTTNNQEIYNIPFSVHDPDDEELKNTVRIRYSNNINEFDYNFILDGGEYLFTDFRIECKKQFAEYVLNNQSNYFRDQDYYQNLLSSVPYTQEQFVFGTTTGVPFWVGEKLNMIFSLHHNEIVYFDGEFEYYERSEGATVEIASKDINYPLYTYSLLVEKTEGRYGQKVWNYAGDDPLEGGFKFTVNINAGQIIVLPLSAGDHVISWGDGEYGTYPNSNPSHTYQTSGSYQIIVGNEFDWQGFTNTSPYPVLRSSLISIDEWGSSKYGTFGSSAFQSCTNLASLPSDSQNLKLVNSPSNLFYGCASLSSIPSDIFRYNTQLINLVNTFYGCISLTDIPYDLLRYNINLQSVNGIFFNATNITSIPTELFRYNTRITSMQSIFLGTSIRTIPENLFRYNISNTTFQSAFQNCRVLENIPEGLFRYNTFVDSFTDTFASCSAVSNPPSDLFRYNVNATIFLRTFSDCVGITNIPVNLLRYNVNALNVNAIFSNTRITEINVDTFRYNTKLTQMASVFASTYITTVPEDLFTANTEVTTFASLFNNCRRLISVPSGLFRNNQKLEAANQIFNECTSLNNIPANLFRYNSLINTFYLTFSGCTSLTSVPQDLFRYNPLVTVFRETFRDCSNLLTIPSDLFRYNTRVSNFTQTFQNCSSLTSRSPLDTNNTELWERGTINTEYVVPTIYTFCFQGATNMENWQYIPIAWGGGGLIREINAPLTVSIPNTQGITSYKLSHDYDVNITKQ